jgi:hypothetical protein
MVVYLASYLAERRSLLLTTGRRIGRLHLPPLAYVGPLLAMFGLAVLLLAWQQDLGAAMLFWFVGYIVADLVFKGVVIQGRAEDVDELEGGLSHRLRRTREDVAVKPTVDSAGKAGGNG